MSRGFAPPDEIRQLVVIERNLRDQNRIRAAGDSAMQGDPPGVPPHHFQNHDALVAGRSGVQAIERVGDCGDSRVEAECHGGSFEIVVDCLRDTDAINPGLFQLKSGRHRAITTHDDQRCDLQTIQHTARLFDYLSGHDRALAAAHLGHEMAAVGRTNDRSA